MNHRNVQIAHELMRALGRIISEELSQEKYGLLTITDCVVTLGLDEAKIYVSALKEARNACNELNRRKKHLIEKLKREVRIRKIPKITFIHDTRPDMVEHLETLMAEDNH
jgi:ribosome-binding factor A